MTATSKASTMTVVQFLDWAATQQPGRHELVNGEVVRVSPGSNRHIDVKMEAWLQLRRAVAEAGVPLHVSGDGVTVVIDDHTAREPDVTVQTLPIDPDALTANEPVIVVEVVSPSSARSDTGGKVAEYFRVPSIRHYLIIDPYGRSVILHSRPDSGSSIATAIHRSGPVALDPPGIVVAAEDLLGSDGIGMDERSN